MTNGLRGRDALRRPAPKPPSVPSGIALVGPYWVLMKASDGRDRDHGEQCVSDAEHFERSLPYRFRSLLFDLGAVVTPGGQGIVVYKGFKMVATLSRGDAESLSPQDEQALRRAFRIGGPDERDCSSEGCGCAYA